MIIHLHIDLNLENQRLTLIDDENNEILLTEIPLQKTIPYISEYCYTNQIYYVKLSGHAGAAREIRTALPQYCLAIYDYEIEVLEQ